MKSHKVSAIMSPYKSFLSKCFTYRSGNWGPKRGSKLLEITNGVSNRSRTLIWMPKSGLLPTPSKKNPNRKKEKHETPQCFNNMENVF